MKLSSQQLAAFFETAKQRSFSKAAQAIGVTQSALSQRISNLESELELTLFVRDPVGLRLTPAGESLFRYCQVSASLESEVLGQIQSGDKKYRGAVRIAAFSSVLRSVIIPSLANFLRQNPDIHFELCSYEMFELPDVLRRAEADFVVMDYQMGAPSIVEHVLGKEEYVVIESAKHSVSEKVFLDHGPQDNATESFFKDQPNRPKDLSRSFTGDVYGIIDGVERGLGRAVMSRHLIDGNTKVRQLKGYRRHFRNVTLHYFDQPYYSKLHQAVVAELTKNAPSYLS